MPRSRRETQAGLTRCPSGSGSRASPPPRPPRLAAELIAAYAGGDHPLRDPVRLLLARSRRSSPRAIRMPVRRSRAASRAGQMQALAAALRPSPGSRRPDSAATALLAAYQGGLLLSQAHGDPSHHCGRRSTWPSQAHALFCDTALAARVSSAWRPEMIALLNAWPRAGAGPSAGLPAIPIAGGVASFAEPDSPYNKVAGLGFAGVPDAAALDEIEAAFAAPRRARVGGDLPARRPRGHGVPLPATGATGSCRSTTCSAARWTARPEPAAPPGVEIRRSGDAELDALDRRRRRRRRAPRHPTGVPWHEEFPRAAVERAERAPAPAIGIARYAALRDGVLAGGGGLRLADGVAQLAGAATAPAHRRHGHRERAADLSPARRRQWLLAATSPWSPPSRARSRCRTSSAAASTCSTRGPCWSSTPDGHPG